MSSKQFRVLSIDGGGMRGLYSATVLDKLNNHFSQYFHKSSLDVGQGFDLIVGTSTGAIIACCLAYGIDTREIVKLYREIGPKLFHDPVPRNGRGFALAHWLIRNWRKAVNDANPLEEILDRYFGEERLSDLYAKRGIRVCVPCINASTHNSLLFKTPHCEQKHHYPNYKIKDVCLGATAAPILFPIAQVTDPQDEESYKTFVDGALWANNPILIGMMEALAETDKKQAIQVISLGTCNPPSGTAVTKQKLNWGLREWKLGMKMMNLALEVQSYAYEQIAIKVAQHLAKPCEIIRLPQSAPSAEQSVHLQMDCASPEALQVLNELGKRDADAIYSAVLDGQTPQMLALKEFFEAMPDKAKVDKS